MVLAHCLRKQDIKMQIYHLREATIVGKTFSGCSKKRDSVWERFIAEETLDLGLEGRMGDYPPKMKGEKRKLSIRKSGPTGGKCVKSR